MGKFKLKAVFLVLLFSFLVEPIAGIIINPASAQIPISGRFLQRLSFGNLASDVFLGGSATIDPVSGTKVVQGGTVDLGGVHTRAAFEITGDPNTTFVITLPTETQIVAKTGTGTQIITLTNLTSFPSGTGVLGPDGKAPLFVGATINLAANQAGATYNGTFQIFVDYPA